MKKEISLPKREVPFPVLPYEEYRSRIQRAKELMEKYNIDAYLITHHADTHYFFGFVRIGTTTHLLWRRAFVIPRDGEPVAIIAHEAAGYCKSTTWIEDVKPWGGPAHLGQPPEFLPFLIETFKNLGLDNKVIGLELDNTQGRFATLLDFTCMEFETLKAKLPKAKFVDAADAIFEQRMIKTDYEQKVIREHVDKQGRALNRWLPQVEEGMTEREAYLLSVEEFMKEGLCLDTKFGTHWLVSGPSTLKRDAWLWGHTDTPTKLKKGDMLWTDAGPYWKGYAGDIQRHVHIGEAPEKLKKMYGQLLEAHEAAMDSIKPGVKLSDTYQAANRIIKKYNLEWAIHHIGHGMGVEMLYEGPIVWAGATETWMPGMYTTIECGIRSPWGILMPEDNILVTKNGRDVLTDGLSRELWINK